MTKPGEKDGQSFVGRFERLDDEVPMTDEEAKVILADAGVDPAGSMKRLFDELDSVETLERQRRFASAEVSRRRDLARLGEGYRGLGRAELLQQLDLYRTKFPEVTANFRNFKSANDDELRSLLAEIEELIRRDSEK